MPDELTARLRGAGCVFAEDEARLLRAAASGDALESLVGRRIHGEPLEHLLGFAEFDGLRVAVAAGVFVPRRRSEFLVRVAAGLTRPGAVVVDVCCGSGALARALVERVGACEVYASDTDARAVACARRNLPDADVREGDLLAPLPTEVKGRVATMLANVPYVPTGELHTMPAEARDHEPRTTHDGGIDGLDVLRRLLLDAPAWFAPGGHVLTETSRSQADVAVAALSDAGLAARVITSDDHGSTVVVGRRDERY